MGSTSSSEEEVQYETIEIKVENRGAVLASTTGKFPFVESLSKSTKELAVETLERLVTRLKTEIATEKAANS